MTAWTLLSSRLMTIIKNFFTQRQRRWCNQRLLICRMGRCPILEVGVHDKTIKFCGGWGGYLVLPVPLPSLVFPASVCFLYCEKLHNVAKSRLLPIFISCLLPSLLPPPIDLPPPLLLVLVPRPPPLSKDLSLQ